MALWRRLRTIAIDGAQAPELVRILMMACGALTEAHSVGPVHHDTWTANIMLCTQGGELDVVKLLDFGLVKDIQIDREIKLTGASTSTGTSRYMGRRSRSVRPSSGMRRICPVVQTARHG